jgi:hypothetical protein
MKNRLCADRSFLFRLIAAVTLAHFLLGLAMAASPQLHEFIHHDADGIDHVCAATLVATGITEAPPALSIPTAQCVPSDTPFAIIEPCWVKSLFKSSRVLEHAPPLIS